MGSHVPRLHTYLLDPESPTEMARLLHFDQVTTRVMGGPLAGVSLLEHFHAVLDVACGPGGWVLDVAYNYPEAEVVGIDISRTMVDYASALARVQHLRNATFAVMDMTQPLDFADQSFDVVNARYLTAALPRDCWPALLAECRRVLRPGGILRVTEAVNVAETTSLAFERVHALLCRTVREKGYSFSPDGSTLGLTPVLPSLLRQAGYSAPQVVSYAVDCSYNTLDWIDFYRNCEVGIRMLLPHFVALGFVGMQEMEALYQQMLDEMHAPSFCGMWSLLMVWGTRPHEREAKTSQSM